jgi:hypothetical protein
MKDKALPIKNMIYESQRCEKIDQLEKWNKIPLIKSQDEFIDFIQQSLANRENINRRVHIGQTTNETQKRIENICGKKILNINIDNNGIVHAHRKENHNLEPDDLLHAADVINTAHNITLSDKKHLSNDVLEFNKDINGEIKFLTETHSKKDFLLVFDAWRKNKARRCPDATKKSPGANVQNDSSHTYDSNIPQSTSEVNEK